MGRTIEDSKGLPPALIELHDSRVSMIVVLPEARMEVHFEHVAVYTTVLPKELDVWSYAAVLRLRDVDRITIDGVLPVRGWVVTDDVDLTDRDDGTLRALLQGCPLRSLRFVFDNGCSVEVKGGQAVLELQPGPKYLERMNEECS